MGYPNYGGRGISVCVEWESFECFYADMGPRPSPRHSIDRVDNDGPYAPWNCRWARRDVQQRNKRNNLQLTYRGLIRPLIEWASEFGMGRATLARRLRGGWSVEDALTTPARPYAHRQIESPHEPNV
jgi:hypothetical protein